MPRIFRRLFAEDKEFCKELAFRWGDYAEFDPKNFFWPLEEADQDRPAKRRKTEKRGLIEFGGPE